MNHSNSRPVKIVILATLALTLMSMATGCAELDQLTKPRVEGLQRAHEFDSAALTEGGFGNTKVTSSLMVEEVNSDALEPMFAAAIRKKRPDLITGSNGLYDITANVIANDVSQREDTLENTIYKWTKRRVKVSYTVVNSSTGVQVWTGIIQTYQEPMASYEITSKKSKDKVLDAVVAALSKTEQYPYPATPVFSDVMKLNFEGLALNLPRK